MYAAAAALIFAWMTALWYIQTRTRNAGIVDIGWTVSVAAAAWVHMLLGPGRVLRSTALTFLVTVWAVRLAWLVAVRMLRERREDPRYAEFRKGYKNENAGFLCIFLFQASTALPLSLPFALAAMNPEPGFSFYEIAGIALWAAGFFGEVLADAQLAECRKHPAYKTQPCTRGLWRYSRHPNYFFEWVMWIGYFVYALGSPWGFLSLAAPLLMLHFLLNISGIPPAEAYALKTKGDAYRQYQKTTSAFVPWFPKKTQ